MQSVVPQSVVDRASKCEHKNSCLTEKRCGTREMCDVRSADGQDILFLCDEENATCKYRVPFGSGQLCSCPVHYWLYTNHQK